jgi:hypothetical protein
MSTVLLVPVALVLERSQSPLSFVTVVLVLVFHGAELISAVLLLLVVLDTWAELISAVLLVPVVLVLGLSCFSAVLMVACTFSLHTYMRCVRRSCCFWLCSVVFCHRCARGCRVSAMQGRWYCLECPWSPCSSTPWKKHNSSYYSEDCSGWFASVCVSLSSFQLDSLSSFQLDSLHCVLNTADHIARSKLWLCDYRLCCVNIERGLVVGETYPSLMARMTAGRTSHIIC